MKKLIGNKFWIALLASGLLGSATLKAQQVNLTDLKGEVLRAMAYTEVTGSPYYMDAWTKGIIRFKDGRIVNGADLKYDQVQDQLLFLNSKGEALELTEPVLEFKLGFKGIDNANDKLFRLGFKPTGKNTEKSFYEILSDGNVKFIKKTFKTILENKEFNSATTTKKIVDRDVYYVVKSDNLPVQVSKNEKSILAAIGDKNAELTAYIKTNKLNLKEDSDILKLFEYYFEISKSKS
ncbi:hypothetical protein [Pedobacter sp. ASV12]|uniref:hypothetical protein n=1 Tax=Pedobacter sp. ASV12 TaxID=2795120 RepID=UPI0018EC7779|nr:hypothetical protein [Pedobacter sp. ASV12]